METGKQCCPRLVTQPQESSLKIPRTPPCLVSPSPKSLDHLGFSSLAEHRPDGSLEGPVSPGRTLGQRGSNPTQRFPPPSSYWNRG